MVEHTPTPWVLVPDPDIAGHRGSDSVRAGDWEISVYRNSAIGNSREGDANAALIVKAVNHHAELVEALRRLMGSIGPASQRETANDSGHAPVVLYWEDIRRARAILAKIGDG